MHRSHMLRPLLALLLATLLLLLPVSTAPKLQSEQSGDQRHPAQKPGDLLLDPRIAGGNLPRLAHYPLHIAAAPSCHQRHRLPTRVRATARLLTTGPTPSWSWRFQLAADPVTETTMLTLDSQDPAAPAPTIICRNSRSGELHTIGRTRLLGLLTCERLEKTVGRIGLIEEHASQLLEPSLNTETALQSSYIPTQQLWLGHSTVHEVRILAGCATVMRSWQLASNGTAMLEFLVEEVEVASPQAAASAGDAGGFRLPTACFREEL